MSDYKDLLIEIGTEELPPKALNLLSEKFTSGILQQLEQLELAHGEVQSYSSPRRLAVVIQALQVTQKSKEVERKGPAVAAAFTQDGTPTKAAEGFARSCGVSVTDLDTQETPKGAWLIYHSVQKGQDTADLISAIVEKSLGQLPIPKRMRWGDGQEEFVRPVHWIVLLFGEQTIQRDVMGIQAGNQSRGHRFHHPDLITINQPTDYASILKNPGHVLVDQEERKATIRKDVEDAAKSIGAVAQIDATLLDEVTALNEWPVPILGEFDTRFLTIPSEVLITTMKVHQKYFPVFDQEGNLKANFITVANIQSQDESKVKSGNERVILPRLSDAEFFWNQDLKTPLEDNIPQLKSILFQKKLGTLFEKSQRIRNLVGIIAKQSGFNIDQCQRSAELCKCDLMTNMVGEFPSLQGIMGRYYATQAGEADDVSIAMEEHYLPRHAGDKLPQTATAQAVAIADKLDTLVGIFAIGQRPTGVKDPFGLRRAALGVLRIIIETPLDLDLEQLLKQAASELSDKVTLSDEGIDEIFIYMMDRLKAYYADQSIAPDVIDAVLAQRPTHPVDVDLKIHAVSDFKQLPEAESLAAANKRIRNILRKTDDTYPDQADSGLLTETAEIELAKQIQSLGPELTPLFKKGDYTLAMKKLASLKQPVDQFFDDVMVMDKDDSLRKNRLALLASVSNLFLEVADLSRLQKV